MWCSPSAQGLLGGLGEAPTAQQASRQKIRAILRGGWKLGLDQGWISAWACFETFWNVGCLSVDILVICCIAHTLPWDLRLNARPMVLLSSGK